MATISNTPRPGYVWDATDNCWYPIGTGPHSHADYITAGSAINPNIVDAKGDLITATAADTPARLAVGTNGQVLAANSSTATGLEWQTISSGGMTLISTINASGATGVSFTSIPTTYKQLMVTWIDVYSSSLTASFFVRLNNSSASVYSASGIEVEQSSVFSFVAGDATNFAKVINRTGSSSSTPKRALASGSFRILDADVVGNHSVQVFSGGLDSNDTPSAVHYQGMFYPSTAAAITQIDFVRSSTQTITGTFKLWGIN